MIVNYFVQKTLFLQKKRDVKGVDVLRFSVFGQMSFFKKHPT